MAAPQCVSSPRPLPDHPRGPADSGTETAPEPPAGLQTPAVPRSRRPRPASEVRRQRGGGPRKRGHSSTRARRAPLPTAASLVGQQILGRSRQRLRGERGPKPPPSPFLSPTSLLSPLPSALPPSAPPSLPPSSDGDSESAVAREAFRSPSPSGQSERATDPLPPPRNRTPPVITPTDAPSGTPAPTRAPPTLPNCPRTVTLDESRVRTCRFRSHCRRGRAGCRSGPSSFTEAKSGWRRKCARV